MKTPAAFFVLAFVVLSGCTSLVEKTGNFFSGRNEKEIARYVHGGKNGTRLSFVRQSDGGEVLVIVPQAFPALRFKALSSGDEGAFYISSLSFIASSVSGWNEFTLELLGTGTFTLNQEGGTLRFDPVLERLRIVEGRIKLNDSRLTGDQALGALRNREERIAAIRSWMISRNAPAFTGQESFEEYFKPLLFPELVSRKKRPPSYTEEDAAWVRADGVRWNQSYTLAMFPEELRPLRDSGAMLRDWEEASAWIYLEYSWESLLESFYTERDFTKIN
ncbi:MAG: hypothetical protein LBH73_08515 [Spirochaetaceae bacterium]|jgi:hypothetical protein|nr:hypothetical protein [Spirochaetaceae bacterium]